jgi:RNA-directed DNA polymerase
MNPLVVDFRRPNSPEEAATLVSQSWPRFRELIDPIKKTTYYVVHRIPKRRPAGGTTHREVWQCILDETAVVHKTFARRLHDFIKTRCAFPSAIAHGYVPGRSTVTNASQHVARPFILRVDIANFFHSISITEVEALFTSLDIESSVAGALAQLATLDSHLPLGLHGSPTIANFACLRMDGDLANLASSVGATVTRYADDITFSGTTVPSLSTVEELLNKYNFEVSKKKCRMTRLGQAHYVTGLSVSDAVPHLPRRMKRRLRQELHFVRKFGLASHITKTAETIQGAVNRLDGTLRYFNAVEPTLAAKLKTEWDQLMKIEHVAPAYSPFRDFARPKITIFIDETVIPTPDGKVLAIAMVLIVELEQVQDTLRSVSRKYYLDQFAAGDKDELDDRGLHYAEDHPDLRTKVFEILESLPVRCFISYDMLTTPQDYSKIFEKLFASLLKYRLMFSDGADLEIVFEENSSVALHALQDLINREFDKLVSANDRRPKSRPTVRFGTKRGDTCLAIADYVLAGFSHYTLLDEPHASTGSKKPGEQAQKRFERLRDRIRVILALPIGKAFSRKQPFQPWPGGRPTISY